MTHGQPAAADAAAQSAAAHHIPAQSASLQPACWVLLPCAGHGSRAGAAVPKQYQSVAGQPLVRHTLAAFAQVARVAGVLAAVSPGVAAHDAAALRAAPMNGKPLVVAACGGATRAHTVFNGLSHLLEQGLAGAQDWVLVHDAARCLITPALVNALLDACWADEVGGLLALPLPDTLKSDDGAGRVAATVARAGKWLAQTPQMFRIGLLHAAYAAQAAQGFAGITDEASAVEAAGRAPRLVAGSARNFKVTYPEDFALAEAVLAARMPASASAPP